MLWLKAGRCSVLLGLFLGFVAVLPARDYLLQQRLDLAAHLLKTTDQSIAEISHHCGYSKQDTLSTRFRKIYGLTPKAYRAEKSPGEG